MCGGREGVAEWDFRDVTSVFAVDVVLVYRFCFPFVTA